MEGIAMATSITAMIGWITVGAMLQGEKQKNRKLRKKMASETQKHEEEIRTLEAENRALADQNRKQQWELFFRDEELSKAKAELRRKSQLLSQKWGTANGN